MRIGEGLSREEARAASTLRVEVEVETEVEVEAEGVGRVRILTGLKDFGSEEETVSRRNGRSEAKRTLTNDSKTSVHLRAPKKETTRKKSTNSLCPPSFSTPSLAQAFCDFFVELWAHWNLLA